MFTIDFELAEAIHGVATVSGFSVGFVTAHDGDIRVSSKDRPTPQTAMVYLSIVELLDGMRAFLRDQYRTEFVFVATDSSFQVRFAKQTLGRIKISSELVEFGEYPVSELAYSIFNDIRQFLMSVPEPTPPVTNDLTAAIADFRNLLQK